MPSRPGGTSGPEEGLELLPTKLARHPECWIAPGAVVVGQVSLGPKTSIWYGCVLRGDLAPIRVGSHTNIQDLTVVHVDVNRPASIGDRVTVGHRSVVHGCTVEDDALIGMGAVLLSGCRIGKGALIAAGAVVLEDFVVPDGAIAAGVPAKIRGEVDEALSGRIRSGVLQYLACADGYRGGRLGRGPHGGSVSGRREGDG